jgi:hypothetical protein
VRSLVRPSYSQYTSIPMQNPCSASVYRIPLKSPTMMVNDIREHAKDIERIAGIATLRFKHPLNEVQTHCLFTFAFPPPTGLESHRSAVLLSLFGWRASPTASHVTPSVSRATSPSNSRPSSPVRPRISAKAQSSATRTASLLIPTAATLSDSVSHCTPRISSFSGASSFRHNNQVVFCDLCQRRVGLWAYLTSAPEVTIVDDALESSAGGISSPSHRVFDVLAEHRTYCPYVVSGPAVSGISSIDQKTAEPHLEGWQLVLDIVLRYNMGSRARNLMPGYN